MPIRLAFSNKTVAYYNYNLLTETREPIYYIKAKHNNAKASKLGSESFGGLEPLGSLRFDYDNGDGYV